MSQEIELSENLYLRALTCKYAGDLPHACGFLTQFFQQAARHKIQMSHFETGIAIATETIDETLNQKEAYSLLRVMEVKTLPNEMENICKNMMIERVYARAKPIAYC